MNRTLRIIMALLMIIAVYCAFRYRMIPTAVKPQEMKRIIVIDPGHGGDDPGKVGVDNSLEKDINLEISLVLKEKLEEAGYRVILTRTDGNGLYDDNAKNKKMSDMKKRCSIIEEQKAELVISIHQNSFSRESVHGAQVFYYKYSSEGRKLAECIQQSIKENVDQSNERVVKDNNSYYMLLHTPCPTVIVECGFLSNAEEAAKLGTTDYQKILAEAICKGVEKYYSDGR